MTHRSHTVAIYKMWLCEQNGALNCASNLQQLDRNGSETGRRCGQTSHATAIEVMTHLPPVALQNVRSLASKRLHLPHFTCMVKLLLPEKLTRPSA